jgi:hypothetical protein
MIKYGILTLLISLSSLCFGKIIECQHFNEIYEHIDKETLIILDIDDTLLIPEQMLGCDEWFLTRLRHHQKHLLPNEALEKALAEWEAIRHLSSMMLVEPNTDTIIEDLQNNHYQVMGLTTQGLALATRTSLQLKEQHIDLSRTAPSCEDHYFLINKHGILFRNGILFTSGQSKASSLKALCQVMNVHPKKIVFVNDKASHLKDVEQYALEANIAFTGLRYGFSDFRKKNFSQDIADYQFSHSSFDKILTDTQAKSCVLAK